MSALSFTKAHGLGNDFVLINQKDLQEPLTSDFVKWISDRRYGIGCDQVLVYGSIQVFEKTVSAECLFFNADGSQAEACGNGTRCLVKLLQQNHPEETSFFIKTSAGELEAFIKEEDVFVKMPVPVFSTVIIEGKSFLTVSIGNPHLIDFVDDLNACDIASRGAELEHRPLFPNRINVSFATIKSDKKIDLKVWERGSGLTMACGTGACAVAVAAIHQGLCISPVVVNQPGGDLEITWDDHVWMKGEASIVFKGKVYEK